MMPFIDGRELIAAVRTQNHCRHIPIVSISSVDQVEERTEFRDLFLSKSFSREQLLTAIDTAIRRRRERTVGRDG
jgi:CheY-like chemotaxis protein